VEDNDEIREDAIHRDKVSKKTERPFERSV
jgi:hypothetical protein